MSRKTVSDEDYNYDDYSDKHKIIRHYKKEDREIEKKRKWDRESYYDLDHDYNERR